jgi:hypothetical protein
LDWKAKVELFEKIRHEYYFEGVRTVLGVEADPERTDESGRGT